MELHASEKRDIELLDVNGWRRIDPRCVASTAGEYRNYIAQSRGEFMVAKNLYVQTRGGWFSDRSICYLASGRPVVAQDTGLASLYPHDAGLLLFSTIEQANDAVHRIESDYPRHAKAARAVAHDCFDSDKVLSSLLSRLAI
jgi:hypothetical protein